MSATAWRGRIATALRTPPHITAAKLVVKADTRARARVIRQRDARHRTFGQGSGRYVPAVLPIRVDDVLAAPGGVAALGWAADRWLEHRFDVLGSGWVDASHGAMPLGVHGHRYDPGPRVQADASGRWLAGMVTAANLAHAQRVWALVSPGYTPIDWHRDVKSGYRWSPTTWYRDITYGRESGVDVKVPWELARTHHLPGLALAAVVAAAPPDRPALRAASAYRQECCDQILDFIATNPPRWGVNWSCAMDVAIRVTNWLVAVDILCTAGLAPDQAFLEVFADSVEDHLQHVLDNLEWSPGLRSNHYLADVCGLAVAAAHLDDDLAAEVLPFALSEVLAETAEQFLPDGSNFEASTAYHRLSAEMCLWATAFALPHDRAPRDSPVALPRLHRTRYPVAAPTADRIDEHFATLARAGVFTATITRPDGAIPQIGDNDSGRFLRLTPAMLPDADGWTEDHLDHAHLVAALGGARGVVDEKSPHRLEARLVAGLLANSLCARNQPEPPPPASRWATGRPVLGPSDGQAVAQRTVLRPGGSDLAVGVSTAVFPDFGLVIMRSSRLYLVLRAGPVGQRGNGGHAHNDQLGLEVVVDGVDWARDPGTYLYTPLPEERDRYRSVAAHWAPRTDSADEPARLDLGLFTLGPDPQAELVMVEPHRVVAQHHGFAAGPVRREVRVTDETVEVLDLLPSGCATSWDVQAASPQQLQELIGSGPPLSRGYGMRDAG